MKIKFLNKTDSHSNKLSKIELFFIAFYTVTLFLGIWHAFPNLDVVHDESGPYLWRVLDTIRSKTIIPHIDYSYTISFYVNYVLIFLIGLLFYKGGFNTTGTNFSYLFWVSRLVTVVAAVFLLYFFLRLAKNYAVPLKQRLIIVTLIFTNIIFATIAHTGKMYMLSLLLFFISFYFLTRAFRCYQELNELSWHRSPIFYSIIFAFLAFANFSFNIIALLNIAYIYYFFYRPLRSLRKLINLSTLTGLAFFLSTFLLNHHGWLTQNSFSLIGLLGSLPTFVFRYLTQGGLFVMPLLLLTLFFNTKKIVEKRLFWIVASYILSYLLLLIFTGAWTAVNPESYWRYLVYPIFFVGLMLLFTEVRNHYALYLCVAVSLVFFAKTIYLLAVPTTYNQMLNYVVKSGLKNSLLISGVPELDVRFDTPPNGLVYLLVKGDVDDIATLRSEVIGSIGDKNPFVKKWFVSKVEMKNAKLIYRVNNNFPNHNYYASVDDNLGHYDYRLLLLDRFGRPIYLYDLNPIPQ